MDSLRIELLPIEQALHNPSAENQRVIETASSEIAALRLNDLTFGVTSHLQCVLWVEGPAETIQTLRDFLDPRNIGYTAYRDGDALPNSAGQS